MTSRIPLASLLTFGLLTFPQSPTIDPPALSNPYARVAWITLNQGVDDNDTTHRKQAIEAVGTVGATPEAVKLVAKGLQDKEVANRQTADKVIGLAFDIARANAELLSSEASSPFTIALPIWTSSGPALSYGPRVCGTLSSRRQRTWSCSARPGIDGRPARSAVRPAGANPKRGCR